MVQLCTLVAAALVMVLAGPARADDSFYRVPLRELTLAQGEEIPKSAPPGEAAAQASWERREGLTPYAVLDGPGEAYLTVPGRGELQGWLVYNWTNEGGVLVAKAPAGEAVEGTLFVPDANWTRLVPVRFSIKPESAEPEANEAFYRGKVGHYQWLLGTGAAGTAHFRHQLDLALSELELDAAPQNQRAWRPWRPGGDDLDDTYNLFSGGRALSENLQLGRPLPEPPEGQAAPTAEPPPVPVRDIRGITTPEFDWTGRLAGLTPVPDALAGAIPADQHAVFFPSFAAIQTVLDETGEEGLPVFRSLQLRSEDAQLVPRYERQLCLSRGVLTRLLGPTLIRSIAVTGSDPYFPTGTDVAVVFEPVDATALRAALLGQQRLAQSVPGVEARTGEVRGVRYDAVVTPDRSISSYLAAVGKTVVVTNSLVQLERLAAVAAGAAPALAGLPEYAFFRARYPAGEEAETAYVFLSDATIRRWCGPEWRIGASRRLRAAAIMSDLTAAHAHELVTGVPDARPVESATPMRTIGHLTLGPAGVASSVYGSLSFLTPIAELDITEVAADEAEAYGRWRQGYERNWQWAFDPIAIRLAIQPDRVSADMSVVPLILGSRYQTWMTITQGAKIEPGAGDPHGALAHIVIATNPESMAAQQASGFARMMVPDAQIDPLGWLGQSVALYTDPDPFWAEMLETDRPEEFWEEQVARLPIALHAEVSSALKLTAFLAAARSFIDQSSPGMTAWETRTHKDQPYVRVGLTERAKADGRGGPADQISVYYAATPRALIVSLNEDVLKRALDRRSAPAAGAAGEEGPRAWLGSSLAFRFNRDAVALLGGAGGRDRIEAAQKQAWSNLPILNEWKRLFPRLDPVEVHQKLWGTRPVCPAGGAYQWNEELRSMESVRYGHPASPKDGPAGLAPLEGLVEGEFGLTFEDDGLRAKGVLVREPR
jgi:hypothetical protein